MFLRNDLNDKILAVGLLIHYSVNEISLRFKEGTFLILSSFFFTGKKNQKPPTSKPRPTQIHPRALVDSARLGLGWLATGTCPIQVRWIRRIIGIWGGLRVGRLCG